MDSGAIGTLWLRAYLSLFLYRRDKPIAAPMHRLDDLLLTTTIPNGLAHEHETLTQDRLAHILLRPELLEEFFLRDHTVTVLHEVDEHIESLRLQRAGCAGVAQLITLRIDFVVAKDVAHDPYFRHERGHYPRAIGPQTRLMGREAGGWPPPLEQC